LAVRILQRLSIEKELDAKEGQIEKINNASNIAMQNALYICLFKLNEHITYGAKRRK
jgi:hypothetical protein